MKLPDQLELKYAGYQESGHAVFAVTLSTYIKDDWFARSEAMRTFWQKHFIYRVHQCLPFKVRKAVDHDYVVERSPHGHFHYHGWLALPSEHSHRIWQNGALRPRLDRALASFRHKGKSRSLRVNKYLVEPLRRATAWAKYTTKTADYIPSMC